MNTLFWAYIEDGHDITTEDDIYVDLQHREGIRGNTVMLLDASELKGPTVSKKFKAVTGCCST
eukprot:15251278-Ditylum_brightwellii.AAC.1